MTNPRAHEPIDKAQHTAPDNAAKRVPLETGEDELEVEQVLRQYVRPIREYGRPNKAECVKNHNKSTDASRVGHEGCLHTQNVVAIIWPMGKV